MSDTLREKFEAEYGILPSRASATSIRSYNNTLNGWSAGYQAGAESSKFVVVDIGCIECGESTEILGIYATCEEAEAAHKIGEYFNRGQHSIEVLEVPAPPVRDQKEASK